MDEYYQDSGFYISWQTKQMLAELVEPIAIVVIAVCVVLIIYQFLPDHPPKKKNK